MNDTLSLFPPRSRAGDADTDPHAIRHVIILGHPSATGFAQAIAATYRNAVTDCRQHAEIRDLYALGFDPLLRLDPRADRPAPAPDIAAEIAALVEAAVITFVYPLWFGMPPAIIKGYIDRVLGAGFTVHDLGAAASPSPWRGKRMVSFSSSASTRPWLEEQGQWVSLRHGIDSYLATIFDLVDGGHVHFDAIVERVSPGYVAECLAQVEDKARQTSAAVLSARHAEHNQARRDHPLS
ncbi:NAD(P)H-dependent oxidoreductase [Sphingomonas sp. RB3P16]|uniref:NAD(P)H-dependent oxidoreductase n=1 Tax=Parasphingomonas frigoris TaxID=3096163 RepID=UPI002FC63550